ncbi:hypothetical protein ACU6U9_16285 [Pseudomonas sp. HK3]
MGYQLTINITNHPNSQHYDLNATSGGSAAAGTLVIYEEGKSIASGATAAPACKAERSGSGAGDVIDGSVLYELPGIPATMIIRYGSKKGDDIGVSPGFWGISVLVELQNNDGSNVGFDDYFAIVSQPWGGSSSTQVFETSIDLYQSGTTDYVPVPTHTPTDQYYKYTTITLFNNTDKWVTLKNTENVQYGYDCVTGGTTCVPPGETLLIYSITEGQPDATLTYNLTNEHELYITAKYNKEPFYSWSTPQGAGSYRLDCETISSSEYIYTLSKNS